jgi:hypothetical protein
MLDKCNTESNSFSDQTETKMQGEYCSVEIRQKSVFEVELMWERDISFHDKKNERNVLIQCYHNVCNGDFWPTNW